MTETVVRTENGAILYDQAIINQISPRHFLPQGWPHAERLGGELGASGRGNTMLVGNVPRQFVLRHYCRGGLIGKVNRDRYFWTGEDNTRSFAEWRILAKMAEFELRVPRPAAARYVRRGTFYTADLITVRIPNVRPLSTVIRERDRDAGFWHGIGAAIREFHAAGVYHADMNANNLMIDDDDRLWMLDFDKGRLRAAGPWQQQTLGRLQRSLTKLKSIEPRLNYAPKHWESLLAGYFEAARAA